MKVSRIALFVVCTGSLFAQKKSFSWENACFKNPGAPYCPGHEFAIPKNQKKAGQAASAAATPASTAALTALTSDHPTPSVIVVGGINWHFADPSADFLAAFSFTGIGSSPIAQNVMSALAANEGLSEADTAKAFQALKGVDQIAVSSHGDQMLILVTGVPQDAVLPQLDAGWKAVPVKSAMLIGPSDAVDQALTRIVQDNAISGLAASAEPRQAHADLWAVGSASAAGPDAAAIGLKSFSVKASLRDILATSFAFEFTKEPDDATMQSLPVEIGHTIRDGNQVHITMALESADLQSVLPQIAVSPLGQYLGTMMRVARYLPTKNTSMQSSSKPVIFGLDSH